MESKWWPGPDFRGLGSHVEAFGLDVMCYRNPLKGVKHRSGLIDLYLKKKNLAVVWAKSKARKLERKLL